MNNLWIVNKKGRNFPHLRCVNKTENKESFIVLEWKKEQKRNQIKQKKKFFFSIKH